MTVSFPDWQTETIIEANKELVPVVYQTKITKTQVIPIYRLADNKGETQDIVVLEVNSFDKLTKKSIFPHASIVPVTEGKFSLEQLVIDMIHNCNALGITVQDGIKDEGWKPFKPLISLPATIPTTMEDILKLSEKSGESIIDNSSLDIVVKEVMKEKQIFFSSSGDGIGYIMSSKVTEDNEPIYNLAEHCKGMAKQFVKRDNNFVGLKELRDQEALDNKVEVEIILNNGIEYVLSDKIENDEPIYYLANRGKGKPKQFVMRDGVITGLKELKDLEITTTTTAKTVMGSDGIQYVLSDVRVKNEVIYHLANKGRGKPRQFVLRDSKFINLKDV